MPQHFFPTDLGTCAFIWEKTELTGFRLPSPSDHLVQGESPPPWLRSLTDRVQFHATGTLQDFSDLPYAFSTVTSFQREVYRQTLAIKPGHTRSYGDLALALNLPPGGSRAVAAALGANPWPLLVPCHRVIGANGKMTGFSGPGGVTTKARLLALEGAQLL